MAAEDDMSPSSPRARLTSQERRIAISVGTGAANKAVARDLSISIKTVEFHLGHIYRKLGIGSRAQLAHLVGSGALGDGVAVSEGPGLPRHPAHLVGRDQLLETLLEAIRTGPLVTLTGPGGVGKTSLALAAADSAAVDFGDGVWFVSLAAVDDDVGVGHAAAIALALSIRATAPTPTDIAAALGRQRRLVLLDNCEHVLDQAARLARAVVDSCPGVVVLVTSRERLHIADERVLAVPPLSVEREGGTSPAARLFLERAAAVNGAFEPDADEIGRVEELCRRVDGLPLAIELAASRVVGFDVATIIGRLDGGLDLLMRRRADDGHHHSLGATIEWSHALLSSTEQALFDALTILPGSFDLTAAVAVAGGTVESVGDGIASLVEQSMVTVEPGGDVRRYRMLEPLRGFGLQRLRVAGTDHELRGRHLHHYLAVLTELDERLRGPHELAAHRSILAEWHHFRTAIDTACERDDGRSACELISHVLWWALTRMRSEVGGWAERVSLLPSAADLPDRIVPVATASYFALLRRDVGEAVRLAGEARAGERRFGELADPWVPVIDVFVSADPLAVAAETQQRARSNGSMFFETLGILQEAVVRANVLSYSSPPPEQVATELERIIAALEMAEHFGNPNGIAYGERNLAGALAATEPERAMRLLEHALETAEPLGLELLVGQIRGVMAAIHGASGRPHDALRVMADALEGHLRSGAYSEIALDLVVCARPLLDVGAQPLVERILDGLGASHLIVEGVVDPDTLGAALFVWLAGSYDAAIAASTDDELVSISRAVIDAAA